MDSSSSSSTRAVKISKTSPTSQQPPYHNFKKFFNYLAKKEEKVLKYLSKKEEKVAPEPVNIDTIINDVNVISPKGCAVHIKNLQDYEKFCKIMDMQKRLH